MPTVPLFLDLVTVDGPWLLLLLAVLETSFVTGLLVPSGVATSIATGIALDEGAPLWPIALAALVGGAIGDSLGFWIGRAGREHWLSGSGRLARRVRAVQQRSEDFFGRNPFVSVTIARVISFVRTVMPMAAGMSDLSYRRYLPYELLGLLLWCSLYMGMGIAAGEGWSWMERWFGVEGALIAAAAVAWVWFRRRTTRARERKP